MTEEWNELCREVDKLESEGKIKTVAAGQASARADVRRMLLERLEVWEASRGSSEKRDFLVMKLCPGLTMVKYGHDWSQMTVMRRLGWVGWKAVRAASPSAKSSD